MFVRFFNERLDSLGIALTTTEIPKDQKIMLDELDHIILQTLQSDARISNAELARRVNLSPPATLVRVRRLEESGYIDGFAALVNRRKLGYDML